MEPEAQWFVAGSGQRGSIYAKGGKRIDRARFDFVRKPNDHEIEHYPVSIDSHYPAGDGEAVSNLASIP